MTKCKNKTITEFYRLKNLKQHENGKGGIKVQYLSTYQVTDAIVGVIRHGKGNAEFCQPN